MNQNIAIIGVGLGGVLVGKALAKQGIQVSYFGTREDAQWHPAALVHPFPGRSFALAPEVRSALEVLEQWMIEELPGQPVWVERPLEPQSRELRTYLASREDYPSWVEHHLDGETLRYRPAWVVDMTKIPAPEIVSKTADSVQCGDETVIGFGTDQRAFDAVVICPGRRLPEWWNVEVVEQGGEVVLSDQHVQPVGLASCGAAHMLPWHNGMALSKSFLAPGQVRADEEVLEDFGARSGLDLAGSEVWRGVRCISDDRQPICGRVHSNVYLLGALGARGLLLGPLLAERLTDLIISGEDRIPDGYSINRYAGSAGPGPRFIST